MKNRTSILCSLGIAAALRCCHAGSLRAAESDPGASIRKVVRMGTLVIETAPGAEVRVEQLRHEFRFGAADPARLAQKKSRGCRPEGLGIPEISPVGAWRPAGTADLLM